MTDPTPTPSASETDCRAIIIGHSHIMALQRAWSGKSERDNLLFINLHETDLVAEANQPGSTKTTQTLGAARTVFSLVGGNGHNVFGLLDHPRPFDFVLGENPSLALIEGREFVPEGIVRGAIEKVILPRFDELASVRRCAPDARLFHLESPPPIPSDDHIARYPGVFREGLDANRKVAPRTLRYKLWCLHCQLFRECCAALGVTVIPVPQETVDEAGFLAEPFWNPDPTHGNIAYGARVLEQISAAMEQDHEQ